MTSIVDSFGVRMLGGRVSYRDGSEDAVLERLASASDTTSSSDELASSIVDWPTRYHFSRLRRNLLSPLRIDRSTAVLEIGCGTGPILRAVGETGASVVGLEGNVERARAARERCRDLPNVTVACGTVDDLDPTACFDLVLLVGVLEYTAASVGGARGAEHLLAEAKQRLKPGGAVAVAIENQLGLKYLLGYPEDHLGVPWAGLDGYRDGGVRTWSRRALARLLDDAGLSGQRWLYPYPDYKLPLVILDEAVLERPAASEIVRKLVRVPTRDLAGATPLVVNENRAFAVLLEAELLADTANSFLVVAAGTEREAALHTRGALAYVHSDERASRWRRDRVLVAGSTDRLELVGEPEDGASTTATWLTQNSGGRELFHRGANLEDLIVDALIVGDVGSAEKFLRTWHEQLDLVTTPGDGDEPRSPWRDRLTTELVPGDAVDLTPRNVIAGQGAPVVVDREWVVAGGCDRDLVAYRACWFLARDLLRRQTPGPWAVSASVDEVTAALADLAGFDLPDHVARRWAKAEGALQALVSGAREDEVVAHLEQVGDTRPALAPKAAPLFEARRLVTANDGLRSELGDARERIAVVEAARTAERHAAQEAALVAARRIAELERAVAASRDDADRQGAHARRLEEELAQFKSTETWRVGSAVTRPFVRLRAIARGARS